MYRRATSVAARAVTQHVSLAGREQISITCSEACARRGALSPSTSRQLLVASTTVSLGKRCLSTGAALDNAAKPEVPKEPLAKPAPDKEGPPTASPKIEKLCNEILELNMLELSDLLKVLKNRLGLSDADLRGVPVAAAPGAGGAAPAAEEKEEEKDAFDIKLVSFDEKSKIKVIKEVRTVTGLGLKEAKELVEGAPKVLKKDVKKEEAEKLVAKLKEVGAKVELV